MHVLNVVTWAVQIFLGLFFVAAGILKLLDRGLEQWPPPSRPSGE